MWTNGHHLCVCVWASEWACVSCNIFLESTWFHVPFSTFIISNSDQCIYVCIINFFRLFFCSPLLCPMLFYAWFVWVAVVNLLSFVLLGKWQKSASVNFAFFQYSFCFTLDATIFRPTTNTCACNGQSIVSVVVVVVVGTLFYSFSLAWIHSCWLFIGIHSVVVVYIVP